MTTHHLANSSARAVLLLLIGTLAPAFAAMPEPWDYFENSWSVIGLKDYPNGTRLTPANELLLGQKTKAQINAGGMPLSRKPTKTLLEGWLPVVLLQSQAGGVRYDFALWATPLPSVKNWRAAFDWPAEGDNFLNWVEVTARNENVAAADAEVRVEFLGTNGPVATSSWTATLKPRQSATTCFRLPFQPTADPKAFAREDPGVWRKRTVDYWHGLIGGGAQISVPCEKATQALRAAHVNQFINNDRGVLKGGEGFYDEFYIRDGAYQILQFEEAGFGKAAKLAIEPYLQHERADGRFETQRGQFDANGQALWTLWQYWKITGDREFLRRAYPHMLRATAWIREARRQEPPESPFAGLLPSAIADGEYLWDGNHHIVGYDLWNLRGLLCTAEAAEALGEIASAADLGREAEEYRHAIEAARSRTGLAHFPPSWEKVGTHWGNTETLWPTELFPPGDSKVTATIEEVRRRHMGGFREGTIRWAGFAGAIHPYMSAYTTMACLARGEHEQFAQDLYWYLLHSTATHAFPEGIFYQRRFAWSDTIPHATGAANYAILLRHALVHERGNELHLLAGIPDWWLEAGREIRVTDAPTHFGPLSLRVRGAARGVEVDFDAPRRQPPARIVLHLPETRPPVKAVRGVELELRSPQTERWDLPKVIERYRAETEATKKAAADYDLRKPAKWRGIHLLAPGPESLPLLKQAIAEQLAPLGINALVFEIGYHFQFQSRPELCDTNGWSKTQARELADFCREMGIRLIPELDCLGHQSIRKTTLPLLLQHPDVDETPGLSPDSPGFRMRSWCPLHPDVNPIVFALMDELVDAFHADAFHVGMDEVFAIASNDCPRCRGKLPEALFARAVNDYYDHLVRQRGLTMLMWGDRLLDDAAMHYGEWESSRARTACAIDLIPRDIVICDWHYGTRDDYPSVSYFQDKGFRVWPASWTNVNAAVALRDWASRNATERLQGHLCTVWGASSTFAQALLGQPGASQNALQATAALRAVFQGPARKD